MRNIILQHWHGDELPDWEVIASKNMRDYAARCGAEYRLLNGTPFFDMLPKQPMAILLGIASNVLHYAMKF